MVLPTVDPGDIHLTYGTVNKWLVHQLFINSSRSKKSALAKQVSLYENVRDLFSGMPGPRLTRSEVHV